MLTLSSVWYIYDYAVFWNLKGMLTDFIVSIEYLLVSVSNYLVELFSMGS